MTSLSNDTANQLIEQAEGSEQPDSSPSGSSQDLAAPEQPLNNPPKKRSSLKAALDNSSQENNNGIKSTRRLSSHNPNKNAPDIAAAAKEQPPSPLPTVRVGAQSVSGGNQHGKPMRSIVRRPMDNNNSATEPASLPTTNNTTTPPPPQVGAFASSGGQQTGKRRHQVGLSVSMHGGGSKPIEPNNNLSVSMHREPTKFSVRSSASASMARPSTISARQTSAPAHFSSSATDQPVVIGAVPSTGGMQTGKARRTTNSNLSGLTQSQHGEPNNIRRAPGDPMGGSASSHFSSSQTDQPVIIGAVPSTGGMQGGKARRTTNSNLTGLTQSQHGEPNNIRRAPGDQLGGSASSHLTGSANEQPVVIGAVASSGGMQTGKARRTTNHSLSGSSQNAAKPTTMSTRQTSTDIMGGGSASSHYSSSDKPVIIGAVSTTGGQQGGKPRRVSRPARPGLSSSQQESPQITRPGDEGLAAPGAVSAVGGPRGKGRREAGQGIDNDSNGSLSSDTENENYTPNVGAVQAKGGDQTGKVKRQVSKRGDFSDEVSTELSRGPEEPVLHGAVSMNNAPFPNPKMSSRPAPPGQTVVGAVTANSSSHEDVKEKIINMQSKLNDPLGAISETETFGAGGGRYMTLEPPNLEVLCESEQSVPQYSSEGASGMTLRASIINRSSEIILAPNGQAAVNTGLYVRMPNGYQGEIRPSLAMVKNQVSLLFIHPTVDAEYKGQIVVMLKNYGDRRFSICDGDPIAKLIVSPCVQANLDKVPEMYGLRAYERAPNSRDSGNNFGQSDHGGIDAYSGHSNTFGGMPQRSAPSGPDEFLPSARPVDEDEDPEKPDLVADHWDTEKQAAIQEERRAASRKKTMMYLGAGLVLVIIVIALAVSLARSNEGETEVIYLNSTGAPTSTPSSAPTTEGGHLLDLLPEATVEAIFQDGSPQSRAYDWLLNDTNWRSYSPNRMVQRFALAAVYYGTDGDNWATGQKSNWIMPAGTFGWLDYEVHECDWAFSDRDGHEYLMETDYGQYYFRNNNSCSMKQLEGSDEEERVFDQFWMSGLALAGSIPKELFLLTHLHSINLFRNSKLVGEIPSQVGLLSDLKLLSISSGRVSGELPETLSKCTKLEALVIAGILSESDENKLTGTIPTWIGGLTELRHLWFEEEAFSGAIPTELGLLTNLVTLYLDEMKLSSTIPTEFGRLTDITVMSFEDNVEMTGTIPTQFGLLTDMLNLAMSTQSFTGTLPSELGLMTDMHFMVAANNQFTGTLPTELGRWSNLWIASLRDNALTGQLPSQMGYMTNCIAFDLYGTQVGGQLPSELGMMKSMAEVFWFNNEFSGTIPTELGLWTDMMYMHLSDNRLSGPIPSQFGRFSGMSELYLGGNDLTGSLPVQLGNISSLVWVNLAGNAMTGEVPPFVGVVDGTSPGNRVFNISGNSFTGVIPESLCGIRDDLDFDCSADLCGCDCDCANFTNNLRTRSLISTTKPMNSGPSHERGHSLTSTKRHLNRPSEQMLF